MLIDAEKNEKRLVLKSGRLRRNASKLAGSGQDVRLVAMLVIDKWYLWHHMTPTESWPSRSLVSTQNAPGLWRWGVVL